MKPPIYCLVDFKVQPDKIGSARKHMRQMEREARVQAGCIQYHFLQDKDDASVFTGYGIWASDSDLQRYQEVMKSAAEEDQSLKRLLDPKKPITVRMLDRV